MKKMRIIWVLVSVFLLVGCFRSTWVETEGYTFLITDQMGRSVVGAIVRLHGPFSRLESGITDIEGYARFNLPSGVYNIEASDGVFHYQGEIKLGRHISTSVSVAIGEVVAPGVWSIVQRNEDGELIYLLTGDRLSFATRFLVEHPPALTDAASFFPFFSIDGSSDQIHWLWSSRISQENEVVVHSQTRILAMQSFCEEGRLLYSQGAFPEVSPHERMPYGINDLIQIGDLSGPHGIPDGRIDIWDLLLLLREYGQSGATLTADLTDSFASAIRFPPHGPFLVTDIGKKDNLVDIRDLLLLLNVYGLSLEQINSPLEPVIETAEILENSEIKIEWKMAFPDEDLHSRFFIFETDHPEAFYPEEGGPGLKGIFEKNLSNHYQASINTTKDYLLLYAYNPQGRGYFSVPAVIPTTEPPRAKELRLGAQFDNRENHPVGLGVWLRFAHEQDVQDLQHIWLSGPGMDAAEDLVPRKHPDDDPLWFGFHRWLHDHQLEKGQVYTLRFVYDGAPEEIKELAVGDVSHRFVEVLEPQANYPHPQDIPVRWRVPHGSTLRTVNHWWQIGLFNLTEHRHIIWIGNHEIQSDGEAYWATLPADLFDSDQRYEIGIYSFTDYHESEDYIFSKRVRTSFTFSIGDPIPEIHCQINSNIWENGFEGIELRANFHSMDDVEGLEHIWVTGPGIPADYDLIEEQMWTQDDPRGFGADVQHPPAEGDAYEFRFVFAGKEDILRHITLGNTDRVFVEFLAPEPWQTYEEPQDVVVQWQLPEGMAARNVAHYHFNLWVDVVNEPYSEGFPVPDPVGGVYSVTIPRSFFEMDKQYRINVAWHVRYEGNDHYERRTSKSLHVRVGEFEDFDFRLQLYSVPDLDGSPRTYLRAFVRYYRPEWPDHVDKILLKGPGIIGGSMELTRQLSNWMDGYAFAKDMEAGWEFTTGDEYYLEVHFLSDAPSRIESSYSTNGFFPREEPLILGPIALGQIPGNLILTNDWISRDHDTPHVFEEVIDLELQMDYDGDDLWDMTIQYALLPNWQLTQITTLANTETQYLIDKTFFTMDQAYYLEVFYISPWENNYMAVVADYTYFSFGNPIDPVSPRSTSFRDVEIGELFFID